METIKEEKETPIVLRTNTLDIGLLNILKAHYLVIVEQDGENIIFELHNKDICRY